MSKFEMKLSPEDVKAIIGDTDDLKVVLRQWVANEVAARYLKPLMNDPAITTTLQQIRNDQLNAVISYLRERDIDVSLYSDGTIAHAKLSTSLREALRKQIHDMVEQETRKLIMEEINAMAPELPRMIDARVNAIVETSLNEKIGKAVSSALKQQFRELIRD